MSAEAFHASASRRANSFVSKRLQLILRSHCAASTAEATAPVVTALGSAEAMPIAVINAPTEMLSLAFGAGPDAGSVTSALINAGIPEDDARQLGSAIVTCTAFAELVGIPHSLGATTLMTGAVTVYDTLSGRLVGFDHSGRRRHRMDVHQFRNIPSPPTSRERSFNGTRGIGAGDFRVTSGRPFNARSLTSACSSRVNRRHRANKARSPRSTGRTKNGQQHRTDKT